MFKLEKSATNSKNQSINTSVNERIRELRKALKLTQLEFAIKIGLSRNFIVQIEAGVKNLSNRTILDICRILNVNEEWLRNGNGVMFLLEDNNNSNICIDSTFLKLLSMLDVEQLNYIKGIVLGTLIADNKVTLEDLCNFKQR